MLIANDPNDLTGNVTILGYPIAADSNTGAAGVLHETTGTLSQGGYTEETVGADVGGHFTIAGAEAVRGMSGGGTFLDFDADGDGDDRNLPDRNGSRTILYLRIHSLSRAQGA